MATTRAEMKEAIRMDGLRVISPAEYRAELEEYIAVTGATGRDLAQIGLEMLSEPARREP